MAKLQQNAPAGMNVRPALAAQDHLGEGPHWDSHRAGLIRVDITAGLIHRWDPTVDAQATLQVDAPVSFAIPRDRGGLVIGGQHSVRVLEDDGRESTIADLPHRWSDIRFNDAKCDPAGRLWAGTMSTTRRPGAAALYRLEADGRLEPVIERTTISNGIGWSPDAELMYFIDSTTQRLDVFGYDLDTGDIRGRRTLVEVDPGDGLPDGLAVDEEGAVWVCLFGGGLVRRYGPDGTLTTEVGLPVSNPTSPVFGGPDLRTVYVTSAKHRLSAEQLAAEPLAGALLAFEPGVQGLPSNRFAG